jgi:hypothetical protein
MKTFFSTSLLILIISACSKQPEIYSPSNVAVNGYDVVSYFTEGKAVVGSEEFSHRWSDAQWNFSSEQNRDLFKASPEKYAPQFGGYCAFGVAEDHTAPTQPDAWTIVDGKLYLNYNTDVMKMWREKKEEYIIQGNKNWPGVLSK